MVKRYESFSFFLGAILIIIGFGLWFFMHVHQNVRACYTPSQKQIVTINIINARVKKVPLPKHKPKNAVKKVAHKKAIVPKKNLPLPQKEVQETVEEIEEEEPEEIIEELVNNEKRVQESQAQQSRLKHEKDIYLQAFAQWIKEHLDYPPIAKRLRQEGTVKISFIIHKDGKINKVEVASACPYKRLNKAAHSLFLQYNSFKPLPHSMSKWELTLPITYALNN